ncbi:MAG: serine hydrolase [Chryseolinea sp.]
MRITSTFILLLVFVSESMGQKKSTTPYFPEAGHWEHKSPSEFNMDASKIADAIQFAKDNESKNPRNLEVAHYQTFGKEPFGDGIGPFAERGDPTGIIIKNGYIIATWGDPNRVDMTFSVTKSFLSSVVGVAFDKGIIKSVDDTVYKFMAPVNVYGLDQKAQRGSTIGQPTLLDLFPTEHDKKITWNTMLRQTSDWEGTLWGKPEWADRPSTNPSEWTTRKRNIPGSVYEYNDVRVNALALAALNMFRRPLPQVLKEMIMDPIGASQTWRWLGYENSWVIIDGQLIQAVGGGGHWGGGMFINAMDMGRFGYLTLNRGKWKNNQLLSDKWVSMALTPTSAQPTYGFMNWFLNTDKKYLPGAPAEAYAHIGNGTNMIYVDPVNNLVIVARWIDNGALDGFVSRVLASIKTEESPKR